MNKPEYKLSNYNILINRNNCTFLWNTLTNAFIKLNEEGLRYIDSFDGSQTNSLFFDILKENGCIVKSSFHELGKVLHDEKAVMLDQFPRSLHYTIAPGLGCNYNCVYCFEKNSLNKTSMSREMQDAVCDYIIQTAERNPRVVNLSITWFGGEPLLYMDAISYMSEKLIDYCIKRGVDYGAGIVTNGRLLTRNASKELKQYKIRYVQLSFDGMQERYTQLKQATIEDFHTTVDNIIACADILPITIRVNVGDTIDDALELTDFLLHEKNLDGKVKIYLAHIRDYDHLDIEGEKQSQTRFYEQEGNFMALFGENGPYSAQSLYYVIPRRRCTTCHSVCDPNGCIGPNGELYRCEHYFGQPEYIVGTIQNGRYFTDHESNYLTSPHAEKCLGCNLFPVCLGGCKNDKQNGDIALACNAFKERMIDNLLLSHGLS